MNLITIEDFLFLVIGLSILFVLIIILYKIIEREKSMTEVEKSKIDMKNLEKITENLERDYKPVNIKLTSYEQEQEDNAIISYQELLDVSKNNKSIDDDFYFEKIEFNNNDNLSREKIDISNINYEKEEAFLKALRELQRNL